MTTSVTTMSTVTTTLTPAHYQVLLTIPSTSSPAIEASLVGLGLDNKSFSTALQKQMTSLQKSHQEQRGKLNGKITELMTTQGTLKHELSDASTLSQNNLTQRDDKIAELEEQNKKIQEEMAKLVAAHAKENEEMQTKLEETQKRTKDTLKDKKDTWVQLEQDYNSQIQSLQTQCIGLQSKYEATESEKSLLRNTNTSLEKQKADLSTQHTSIARTVYTEDKRQQTAIDEEIARIRQQILNPLNVNIGTYTAQANLAIARFPDIANGYHGHDTRVRIRAPDGTDYNPVAAKWAAEWARDIVEQSLK